MKLLQLILIVIAVATGSAAIAQSKIQSQDDYKRVQGSINAVSKKLYDYARLYPAYSFSAQYDEDGKLVTMNVKGVSNEADATRIENYLMELESLGQVIRNMNIIHLPTQQVDPSKNMLTENEAKNYTPSFDRTEPTTSAL